MTDLLVGVRSKLERAEENILNLNREIDGFLASDPPPYKVVGQHQNDGREYAFIGYATAAPPPRLSVMAGEIIHHLRSCLDHLLHALIIKNGGRTSNNNQFPISKTSEEFERACNSGLIGGVSRSAKNLIRSVQPYANGSNDNSGLYAIHQLDILDKHRLLVVLCTLAQIGGEIKMGADQAIAIRSGRVGKSIDVIGLGDPKPRRVTEDGVQLFTIRLAESTPEFYANAKFIPQIAFEKCGTVALPAVIPTLSFMFRRVVHIVDQFLVEF